ATTERAARYLVVIPTDLCRSLDANGSGDMVQLIAMLGGLGDRHRLRACRQRGHQAESPSAVSGTGLVTAREPVRAKSSAKVKTFNFETKFVQPDLRQQAGIPARWRPIRRGPRRWFSCPADEI
ncbi:MAG TPA: hypothetical protein VHQ92_07130, partial [Pseudolabrys sp.]|nr:hypothetical protein [Pseudolabrys sp.]